MNARSLLLFCGLHLFVTTASPAQVGTTAGPAVPLESGELETFLDDVMSGLLVRHHNPGAVVSVVSGGELLLAKGYGYANLEKQLPVDPQQTRFQIGSTAKLFTWTSVMQLVEQRRLDLDVDINGYLPDFRIPATYPQPITMRHLLTHTAGFEEQNRGMLAPGPEKLLSLHDFLARYQPARVRPPGEATAYSNYGVALAGYVVEVVSGLPFARYVEEQIYRPLNMEHSSFRQSLAAHLSPNLAQTYGYDGEAYYPLPFAYLNAVPAGAMSTTATDMTKFMIAHLQYGRFAEKRILEEETARQMQTRLFANDARLSGFAYGFFDFEQNGQRVLSHNGSTANNANTLLALLPEQKLGIVASFTGPGGRQAVADLQTAFIDNYFPRPATTVPSAQVPPAPEIAGPYRMTRTVYNHLERLLYLGGLGHGRLVVNDDGTVTLTANVSQQQMTKQFVALEPLLFQSLDGRDKMTFRTDAEGRVTYLFLDSAPHFALEKIPWYETPVFNLVLLGMCLLTFVSVLLLGFVGTVLRWRRKRREANADPIPALARIWEGITTMLFVIATGVLALHLQQLAYETKPSIYIWLALLLRASLASIGTLGFAIVAWRHRYWSLVGRIHYTVVALGAVAFVWLLNTWNLLGFRL